MFWYRPLVMLDLGMFYVTFLLFLLQILSKDSVSIAVDAVVYYKIFDATISVTEVEDVNRATRLLSATTLRNILGTKTLSEVLTDRETISNNMQVTKLRNYQ